MTLIYAGRSIENSYAELREEVSGAVLDPGDVPEIFPEWSALDDTRDIQAFLSRLGLVVRGS